MTGSQKSISKIVNDFGANKGVVRNKTDDNRIYCEEKNTREQFSLGRVTDNEEIATKMPLWSEAIGELSHVEQQEDGIIITLIGKPQKMRIHLDKDMLIPSERKKLYSYNKGDFLSIIRTDISLRPIITIRISRG